MILDHGRGGTWCCIGRVWGVFCEGTESGVGVYYMGGGEEMKKGNEQTEE